jgi:hypothetical protein
VRFTCRACFRPMSDFPENGRPPETCRPDCRRKWKAARERARRARREAIGHLGAALVYMRRLGLPTQAAHLARVLNQLEEMSPRDVAIVGPQGPGSLTTVKN